MSAAMSPTTRNETAASALDGDANACERLADAGYDVSSRAKIAAILRDGADAADAEAGVRCFRFAMKSGRTLAVAFGETAERAAMSNSDIGSAKLGKGLLVSEISPSEARAEQNALCLDETVGALSQAVELLEARGAPEAVQLLVRRALDLVSAAQALHDSGDAGPST